MYFPLQDRSETPRTAYTAGGGHPLDAPSLRGDGHPKVDIVVIGGGVTGVSLALHAAQQGARVVLLEANEIGWGASGRNGGHVPPATKWEPTKILKEFGPERGERLIKAVGEAPDFLFNLAEKYNMDADVVRSGVITAAFTPRSLDDLRAREEFWASRGAPVTSLNAAETARAIGTDRYAGSSLDPRGGTVNPLAFVRGLARAAIASGVEIYERSRTTGYRRNGTAWTVVTENGTIAAEKIAICTNAYSGSVSKQLGRSIVPVRAYQFLTEPMPAELRHSILPGRQGVTDTRRLMSGFRVDRTGGLFFSGLGRLFGEIEEPDIAYSFGRMRKLFPQLAHLKLAFWWTGWMAMNEENTWKLHELEPGVVAALGCNGRGLAIGTMLGREIAQYLNGKPERSLLLPISPIKPIRLFSLHHRLVPTLVNYYRVRDAIDDTLRPQ